MLTKDEQILQHIIKYCNQIDTTVKELNVTKNKFEENFIFQNALSMPILQIGELVKRFSDEFVKENPEIPWRYIAGMRNRLVHEYTEINLEYTWNTVSEDIPALNKYCKEFLKSRGISTPESEKVKTYSSSR